MIKRVLVEVALPLACAWSARQERSILHFGQPLSEAQLRDARRIGIAHAENIRVMQVAMIPPKMHPFLRYLAAKFGMAFSGTLGMALGYGIFIREGLAHQRMLLAHELAHVRQYERLGRSVFLRQYLHECLHLGYPHGRLEAEARDVAEAICT